VVFTLSIPPPFLKATAPGAQPTQEVQPPPKGESTQLPFRVLAKEAGTRKWGLQLTAERRVTLKGINPLPACLCVLWQLQEVQDSAVVPGEQHAFGKQAAREPSVRDKHPVHTPCIDFVSQSYQQRTNGIYKQGGIP